MKEYAMYKGDKFIDLGSPKELAKKYNMTAQTIYWYATSTRAKKRRESSRNNLIIIPIEEEEE